MPQPTTSPESAAQPPAAQPAVQASLQPQASQQAALKTFALQDAIFYSANFSSIATDARGVIQIFNVGAERMLGYQAADVLNKVTPADISDPKEVIARAKALSDELGTPIAPGFEALVFKASRGIEDIYELTYVRKDGSRLPAVVSVTALRDAQGVIIGYLLIGTDNTARKRVEAERARLEQVLQDKNTELEAAILAADKANQAKTDFLSNMSHELRTPLNAILGFAQLLESGSPEPTVSQKRGIGQILHAGWFLLDLINELLDLALIESGKISLSREPVNLAEVLQQCLTMVGPQAKKRGIGMNFPQFDVAPFISADRTRIKQVIINLLSNAIKYNRVDGTVTVTCKLHTPGCLRLEVRDTGDGLSNEQIEQLFQPFNRLGQEAKGNEGTGIGLVVCKRLVDLMGGVIGVHSIVGSGSIFWIELDLAPPPLAGNGLNSGFNPDEDIALVQVAPPAHAFTLLCVEDNPANLMLIEDLVARRPDVLLLTAGDGLSGIEMARSLQPDAILMDINLPGINGFQAQEILALGAATAHIPVVALSANAMPRDIEKGLAAGFFAYITKPIRVGEFMAALDRAFQHATDHKNASKSTPGHTFETPSTELETP